MERISSNIIRQVLLLAAIVILGVVLFDELRYFLPALMGAYTLYVLLRRFMFILTGRYRWQRDATAIFLMLLSFLIILLPIMMIISLMSSKITYAVIHSSEILHRIQAFISKYEQRWDVQILTEENIKKVTDWASAKLPAILNATFNTLTSIAIMYFVLYFMLINGKKMETGLYQWVPVKEENVALIRKEIKVMVISNAVGIPVIALLLGVLALLGYFLIGVDQPIFWFAVTTIAAMLPIIGAALAYVPLGILYFANGDSLKGTLILLYGFIIIGGADHIFRFVFNKKFGDIHPLITVFGVIVGVSLFGFIGLIFGPLLVSLFLLLAKIYMSEYSERSKNIEEVGPH